MTDQKPLLAIIGPTAAGKSTLAMEVARQWAGDSLFPPRPVFRERVGVRALS